MANSFFDYFPTPHFLEMPYVGFHITPKAARFIEIIKGHDKFEVGRFGEKRFAAYNPAITLKENKELIEALASFKRENNLSFVEVALPDEKAYVFKTNIPSKSSEIRSSIEFHLEENVPISLEEAIFDYHIISPTEATVSVLPREVVQDYVDVFAQAGLTTTSFLVGSQAISKAVIKKGDVQTYLVVHIGDTKTDFSVVSEESVQFTSTIAIGADDFTGAIVKQFNVTAEEAKKMKREKGFVKNKNNSDLFFSLISIASALKDEAERIYVYWHTHIGKKEEPREKISKILFLGCDAAIVGFKEYLAESIRTQVEIANVWTNVCSFEKYIPPIEWEDSLDYGAVIGLALPKL